MAKVVMSQRKADAIVVTGLGMISSIGRDVVTSCASARAGITRESELDYFSVFDEDSDELNLLVPVAGHAIAGFSEGFVGLGRLVRIGHGALSDLLTCIDIRETSFAKTGFFLNLSSSYYLNMLETREKEEMAEPDRSENDTGHEHSEMDMRKLVYGTSLVPKLCELCEIDIDAKLQRVYFKDHIGIIAAISDAMNLLKSGKLDRCIIGGVESYIEQKSLEILSACKVLKTSKNPGGFIPGEAAAFILLERYDMALQRNVKIEGVIESPSLRTEAMHQLPEKPSTEIALSDAISATLDGLADKGKNTGIIIGNLNGDHSRAKEWGNSIVRVITKYPIGDHEEWYPAASFGEIGAATGVVAICMGVRAFVRNYAGAYNILIWLANNDGHKGSIYMRQYSA